MSMQPDNHHYCFGNYETAQLALKREALGLIALVYRPVVYCELHCENCATVRTIVLVIDGLVDRMQACPVCGTERKASVLGLRIHANRQELMFSYWRQSAPRPRV